MSSTETHRKAIIGSPENFWLHSSRTERFDLTHPSHPNSPPITPRLDLSTTTTAITVDPAKTALVIIDMQNFFLSSAFGRAPTGAGHSALRALTDLAIPAARKAGIRIIWLNWGLTDTDMSTMPPAIKRAFGFEAVPDAAPSPSASANAAAPSKAAEDAALFADGKDDGVGVDSTGSPRHVGGDRTLENGKDGRIYRGLGSAIGPLVLPSGGEPIDAGKLLYRDTWNAALHPPLDALYAAGAKLAHVPDVWIHKNRMSGLWGASTPMQEFCQQQGIRSLLFAGVNTDQCVSGTLTDAFSKGFDCVLLNDACGTTSPEFARDGILFNAAKTWGFVAGCEDLKAAVEEMAGGA